jgi:hypothetical protein
MMNNNPDEQGGSVLLETTMGPITIELYWLHAPRTCRNFYELSKRGYYDNTIFHRIIRVRRKLSETAVSLVNTL